MAAYEEDPDVRRWGLHQLLTGDAISNSGYYATATQHDVDFFNGQYVDGCPYAMHCANRENDAVIEHYLQEQVSQLSVADAYSDEEPPQPSDFSQDWLPLSMRNLSLGYEVAQEGDDMESSSSSSPWERSDDGDWYGSLELQHDYSAIDGEVGKRLHQMVPIPHVPRTNGDIPSMDEAMSDHERLLERLQVYDLLEFKVLGDGNCQFRALSDQFYRTPEHHKFVREQIINQLKCHRENYEGYVPMAYNDYLNKLSQDGEWGDHVTLQAAADSYGVKIFVITSFKDTCYIEILPNVQKSRRVIFLSFWAEVHYNSIYPEGG